MVHEDFPLAAPGRDDAVAAQRDIFHGGSVDDAHQNDVAGPRDFGRAFRGHDAPIRCRPGLRLLDVEADDPIALLGEPAGKTLSHQAEADEADRAFRHEWFSV